MGQEQQVRRFLYPLRTPNAMSSEEKMKIEAKLIYSFFCQYANAGRYYLLFYKRGVVKDQASRRKAKPAMEGIISPS